METSSPRRAAGQGNNIPDHQLQGSQDMSAQTPCHNCRARKVKCDRRQPSCIRCDKLKIACFYTSCTESKAPGRSRVLDSQPGDDGLTLAGIQRRRIGRACDRCRVHRSKCSGGQPCQRCQDSTLSCVYRPETWNSKPLKGTRRPGRKLARETTTSSSPAASSTALSGATRCVETLRPCRTASQYPDQGGSRGREALATATADVPDGNAASSVRRPGRMQLSLEPSLADKAFVRRCIEAYFAQGDSSDCIFLHKASLLSDWNRDKANPTLVKILCALSLRLDPDNQDNDICQTWAKDVQHSLLASSERSISSLQALVLLIRFHFSCDFSKDAWVLLPVAARVAFTMRLNHERPAAHKSEPSPFEAISQECLRRLMWAIFITDHVLSSGIEDLAVCPPHRMKIRVPCDSNAFQRGIVPEAPFLHEISQPQSSPRCGVSGMDASSYRVILYDLRERILRYTRQVIASGSSPIHSRKELQQLDDELHRIRTSLPARLQLDRDRLVLMVHSEESTAYLTLHFIWFLLRCDLHRFLIPGIRQGVKSEAWAATPQTYVDYCQGICLSSAASMCDLVSDIQEQDPGRPMLSPIIGVGLYQCAQIIDHLSFRIPSVGPHSCEELKRKLNEGLALGCHLGTTFKWLQPCIEETKDIISDLGRRHRPSPSTAHQQTAYTDHSRCNNTTAPSPSCPGQGAPRTGPHSLSSTHHERSMPLSGVEAPSRGRRATAERSHGLDTAPQSDSQQGVGTNWASFSPPSVEQRIGSFSVSPSSGPRHENVPTQWSGEQSCDAFSEISLTTRFGSVGEQTSSWDKAPTHSAPPPMENNEQFTFLTSWPLEPHGWFPMDPVDLLVHPYSDAGHLSWTTPHLSDM